MRRAILAVLTFCALAAPASASADNPLVGEWHFDSVQHVDTPSEDVTPDSSGSGNDLTTCFMCAQLADGGKFSKYLSESNNSVLQTQTGIEPQRVTLLAWMKKSGNPVQDEVIAGQQYDNATCGPLSYALYSGGDTQDTLRFSIRQPGATVVSASDSGTASDGQWHLVAGVFDGSAVRLYVDGVEQENTPTTASTIEYSSSAPGVFGADGFSSVSPCSAPGFTGGIDELRVYNRALSASEIAGLAAATGPNPPELSADSTSTNVNCAPGSISLGDHVTCTAAVNDTAASPQGAPTGQVSFTSDSPGTFSSPGATCTLTATGSSTSICSVTYTPTAVGSGVHHLTAAYPGDTGFNSSSGTATVGVTAAQGPPGGQPGGTPGTPPPKASFTGPTSTRAATPFTLNASATHGATTLVWSVNGQAQASCSAQTPNVTLQAYKPSTVTLTALGPGGSSSTSHVITLNGNSPPPPVGGFTRQASSLVICSGGAQALDTTAHGGPPAGCTTTVNVGITAAVGCFTTITDPAKVPSGEAPILNGMLAGYEASPSEQQYGKWYCTNIAHCTKELRGQLGNVRLAAIIQFAGLYVSRQPVRINGIDFTPLGGAAIAYSPGFQRVVSSRAIVQVGGVPIKVGQINLDLSNNCGACGHAEQPIASFDSKGLPGAGDFPFTGTADIKFVQDGTDRHSEINGHVELPPSLGGTTVDGVLRADNTNGIQPKSFHVHIDGIGFDDIGITDTDIYFQAPADWAFFGNIGIGTAFIEMRATQDHPFNGIVFHNGSLDHAGATLNLRADPPEIAPGVNLEEISLSFAADPSALRGSMTLNALGVADVTGNMVLAFPSPRAQFQMDKTDLPGAPAALLRQRYSNSPVIGLGGAVSVVIPNVGEVPLGSGYMLYAYPAYVAAGGELDAGIKNLLTIDGRLDGQFNVVNRRFNLGGEAQGCVEDICGAVDAAVSSQGAGLCFGDFGGGFKWADFPAPHVYGRVSAFGIGIGTACDVASFSEDHVFARVRVTRAGGARARAAAARTIVVKRGKPLPEVRLDGDTGAPNVAVTGPGGQSVTATGLGIHRSGSIVVIQSERLRQTFIGVKRLVPGTYTITPLPGPAVVSSWHASEPAPISVRGHVTGTGTRRVLQYNASRQPGTRITFLEVVHGVPREIGSTAGGKGSLHFTTAPGPDARVIIAAVTRYGVGVADAQHLAVARFSGPAFVHPGRPGRPLARWRSGVLQVSWGRARNAVRYAVTLRERHGNFVTLKTRAHTIRLRAAHPTLAGTVSVAGVSADGSRGAQVSVRYRAKHAPVNRFIAFSALRKPPKK